MSNTTDTNQASKVKRNSLNKSDIDVKLEPMSKNTTDREEWRNWLASHGLPHDEVEGELILDFIEALISNREKLARIDELREAARHADRMYPECDNVLDHIENRITTLRKELE